MIDEIVSTYMKMNAFSGTILVSYQGKTKTSTYGFADLSRRINNRVETRYHIASVSKPFTAVAIMMLIEEGSFRLDTTLDQFVTGIANSDKITVHHLLSHHSGLPNINSHRDYHRLLTTGTDLAELVNLFRTFTPNFPPGERYQYSNTNYNLLAHIIEQESGLSYGDFLSENIFEPLGMNNSLHHGNPTDVIANEARGYVPDGRSSLKQGPYLNWSVKTGNGSLVSTVKDLFKFHHALVEDQLVSSNSFRSMVHHHYGLFTSSLEDRKVIYINGRSPGFTARYTTIPQEDLSVIILSNNYTASVVDLISESIIRAELGLETEKLQIPCTTTIAEDELEKYTGEYQFGNDFFSPGLKFSISSDGDIWEYSADGDRSPLVPTGDRTFFSRLYWAHGGFEKEQFYFDFNKRYYALRQE